MERNAAPLIDRPGARGSTRAVVSFGTALRQARLTAGLTHDELARAAGMSYRAVVELERGEAHGGMALSRRAPHESSGPGGRVGPGLHARHSRSAARRPRGAVHHGPLRQREQVS